MINEWMLYEEIASKAQMVLHAPWAFFEISNEVLNSLKKKMYIWK